MKKSRKKPLKHAVYWDCIHGARLQVFWDEAPPPKTHQAECEQNLYGALITFYGPIITLQSIAHELHHAVDWFAALEKLNGREEQATQLGLWVEDVVGTLLGLGWKYGTKAKEQALFNVARKVALHAPY